MMFAPMRSAMAMQQSHCNNMDSNISNHNAVSSAVIPDYSGDHDIMVMLISSNPQKAEQKVESAHGCCSGQGSCTSDCDMGVSVSLLMQESSYVPNLTNISESVALITDLIKREFIPPFRPPLVSHS